MAVCIADRVRQWLANVRNALIGRAAEWSLAQQLMAIIAVLALPLNVGVVMILWGLANANLDGQRASLLYSARSVAAAVDAELGKYLLLGHALARSPALLLDDLTAFEAEARRAFDGNTEAWLLVADLEGMQIMNLAAPPGLVLPRRRPETIAAQQRALVAKAPVVSDLVIGPVRSELAITIDFPIYREGEPYRSMAVVVRASTFLKLLNAQNSPENWLSGIIDGTGRFVARYPNNDERAGQLASEGWRASRHLEGVSEFRSLEQDPIYNANANSAIAPWSISVAVKKSEFTAAVWRSMTGAILLGALLSTMSLTLAALLARRLTSNIDALRDNAITLVEKGHVAYEPGMPEARALWSSLREAVESRNSADAKVQLVMREVNHRSKNLLGLVQAIARQTATSSPGDFTERLRQRLSALSASQDLLVGNGWKAVPLDRLVATQLDHHAELVGRRITASGPPVHLSASAAQTLGMVLHELATNAVKYGALSNGEGTIGIEWTTTGGVFEMRWREAYGPTVAAPARRGFGSTVIDAMVKMNLAAEPSIVFAPSGLEWSIRCPLSNIVDQPAAET